MIEAYEEGHPATTRAEIRDATRLTLAKTGPDGALTGRIIARSVGALTLVLFAVFAFLKSADRVSAIPWTLVAVTGLVVVFGIVAVIRRR